MPRREVRTHEPAAAGNAQENQLDLSQVATILNDGGAQGGLIALLQRTQRELGFVPEPVVDELSRLTGVPASRIYGILTFYTQFSTVPSGRHKITVCKGTACHVAGATRIEEALAEELGVDVGETTSDSLFTLQAVGCVGACALAPVVRVGEDETHGRLTPDEARRLVDDLRRREGSE